MSTPPVTANTSLLDDATRRAMQKMAENAAALHEMSGTRGYAVLVEYLEQVEIDLGRFGLRDKEHSRDYYVGAQEMVVLLLTLVPRVVELGREVESLKAVERSPEFVKRFVSSSGGGSLA